MENKISIRTHHLEDVYKVVELVNYCFPEQNITKESFEWKHSDPVFNN